MATVNTAVTVLNTKSHHKMNLVREQAVRRQGNEVMVGDLYSDGEEEILLVHNSISLDRIPRTDKSTRANR